MLELLMSHIFISYSSQHRDLTAKLAERLGAEGYPVWWDKSLEACGPYDTQIEQALQDAAAVIVIWSVGAAKSDWVRGEVIKARASHKLVNLRAPDFPLQDIPAPFNDVEHVIMLNLDELEPVLKTVNTVWRGDVPVGIKPRYLSHGDQYGVALFSPKQLPRPDDIRELLPSHLLQARYEIVPYVDTTGLLAEMLHWCLGEGAYEETPRTTAGRLLFGPGGQGKTRLMIELARKLRDEHGWLAGFAEPPRHPGDQAEMTDREQSIAQVLSGGEEPGVLMILDYAEGRRDEVVKLARLARPRPREGVRPVRVVLLSRGDAWWQDLYGQETEVEILFQRFGMTYGDTIAVDATPEGKRRQQMLNETLTAFRPLLEEMSEGRDRPAAREGRCRRFPLRTPRHRSRLCPPSGAADGSPACPCGRRRKQQRRRSA